MAIASLELLGLHIWRPFSQTNLISLGMTNIWYFACMDVCRFREAIIKCKDSLLALGDYPSFTVDDFHETVRASLTKHR